MGKRQSPTSPQWGEGWGEGGMIFDKLLRCPLTRRASRHSRCFASAFLAPRTAAAGRLCLSPLGRGGASCAVVPIVIAIVLAALPPSAQAQDTARAVKMIVPVPAGGITDVLARTLQDWLGRKWGQPIVIDNRPGAGGNLGTEAAFRSDPDGSTLLISIPGPLTVNPTLYP